ncbi:MAG: hypothetical protein U1F43_12085 [Myxococcota bacterium]
MARGIVVARDGHESRFGLQVVDRAKLYGQRRRVVVDEKGEPCATGYLSVDGSVLLLSDSRALLYLDERADVVERSELHAVDDEGRPLAKLESTLDAPQAIVGPVAPERVLDMNVTSVYRLEAESVDEELAAALARGEIWETIFNYMPGYERQTLFLLQNPEGIFGLVTEPSAVTWMDRQSPPPSDEDPLGDDELDFSMF